MPRIKQSIVVNLVRDIKTFLRLDVGIGFHVPDDPERLLRIRDQHLENLQERIEALRKRLQKQERLHRLQEQERTQRHQEALKKVRHSDGEDLVEENPTGILKQTHALPEPDSSVRRMQILHSLISPLKPGKMLDLGVGPGKSSLVAARLGWEVTAVDARNVRWPDPETEDDPKTAELIRSIKWVEADVRDFPIDPGEYDLICWLGMMHHLELEDQLKLFKRCSDTLMILDARVAPEVVVTEGPYEGWYYREKGESREERDKFPSASWGNEISFTPTEESLLRMLLDCGFAKVMPMRPPHHHNYTFYLCLP